MTPYTLPPGRRPVADKVAAMKARREARRAAARPGYELLDETSQFVSTLIYAPRPVNTVLTVGSAISHIPEAFSALPRFGVMGPGEAGKSSVLDVVNMLSDGAWMSDATVPGLRAWYNKPGNHCLEIDEIGKAIFGESGLQGKRHPVYKILADGYRRTATLSFSNDRNKEDVSSYGVAWYAGKDMTVPDDIARRSIMFAMTRVPEEVELEDTLDEDVIRTGHGYRQSLHDWMAGSAEAIADYAKTEVRLLDPSLTARRRQIWGPGFATCAIAGGDWPERWMEAYLALGMDKPAAPALTPGQQLTIDVAALAEQYRLQVLFNVDLIDELQVMDERPYGDTDPAYLRRELNRVLGPDGEVSGHTISGVFGTGTGRTSAPIIKAAEAIRRTTGRAPATPAEDPRTAGLDFTPANIQEAS
jgi:hypothetical protein